MWQMYALLAENIARERRREAEALALARIAEGFVHAERRAYAPAGNAALRRAGAARHVLARMLRAVSDAAGTLSRSACDAAARVDGRAL